MVAQRCECNAAAAVAKSLQSCLTLHDCIDNSPPGSAIPGILQARTLEWVAISFSSAWKWKVKVKSLHRVRLFATPWTAAHQAPPFMGFSRQEYWNGVPLPSPCECTNASYLYALHAHSITQSCPTLCNPMDCSPPGSSVHGIFQARILEWVAMAFSKGSSQLRDCILLRWLILCYMNFMSIFKTRWEVNLLKILIVGGGRGMSRGRKGCYSNGSSLSDGSFLLPWSRSCHSGWHAWQHTLQGQR